MNGTSSDPSAVGSIPDRAARIDPAADEPVPDVSAPDGPAPDERAAARGWSLRRLLADRAAVLVAGLVAGFAVGLSFAPTPDAPPVVPPKPVGGAAMPGAATAPATADAAVDPRVIRRVAASGTVRIGIFGDSFGMGVWDGVYRRLPRSDGYEVFRFARQATGFTRYRAENMEDDARAQLARDPVDIAVIVLGLNDATDMWEGKLYTFMSDDWKRVIGDRIDRFVTVAGSTGAAVYWLGLPAMRDPARDAKVQALNAFYAERMKRLGIPYLDTRALSVGKDGRYSSHLPDAAGVPRMMRTGDGMHMIGIGYERIARDLIARLQAQSARIRVAARRPVAPGTAR